MSKLAARINLAHEKGEAARRKGLAHYRRAGEALIQAKSQCAHGQWGPWLKAHIKFSERRARHYMEWAKTEVTK